jgi:hypothetical protein
MKKKLFEIEYAIKDNDKIKIKKILKKNQEEFKNITVNKILDLIHFDEIETFEEILNSLNDDNKKYLLSINEIINELINNNKIDIIKKYFQYITFNIDESIFLNLCTKNKCNYELIKLLYNIYKSKTDYSLLNTILLEHLKLKKNINLELIKFFIKLDQNVINNTKTPLLLNASLFNNIKLLKLLKEYNIEFYYDNHNVLGYYINNVIYVNNIDNNIILFLLNNGININICDNEMWTPAHYIFFKPEFFTIQVKKKILEKTENLNIQNTLGNTVLYYIILNDDINNYKTILEKKELDIFVQNKALITPLSLAIQKKINLIDIVTKSFITQIKKDKKMKNIKYKKQDIINYILNNKISIYKKKIEYNDIIITDYKYSDHNKFYSVPIYINLYIITLLNKYDFIGVPYLSDTDEIILNNKYSDIYFNEHIEYNKKFILNKETTFFRIYWGNENNYFINPNMDKAIDNVLKFKKYLIIYITICNNFLKNTSHANILLIDKEKKLIIHFEPHGSYKKSEEYKYYGNFYDTLKKYFSNILKNYKYIPPTNFLPIFGYQNMYNESNRYVRKFGDLDGYCSAWCFWFIELYIINNKYNLKDLVNKSIKKLINTKYTIFEHIRNYANHLHDKTTELLLNYGLSTSLINNSLFNDNVTNFILNKISVNIKNIYY